MSHRPVPRIFSNSPSNIEDHYEIADLLGEGHFAKVRKGISKRTGEGVALKILPKKNLLRDAHQRTALLSEIDILTSVTHPNIISLKAVFETDDKLYLVMELVTGGELFDRIVEKGSYTEVDACNLMRDLLVAVKYLHDRNIAHRDLKPENILLSSKGDDAIVKISDFGLSKIVGNQQVMRTCCGTPGYVAPEVLNYSGYGPEIDMWSLGVILYILLCGFPPFYDENDNDAAIYDQIRNARYEFIPPYWDRISEDAKDLIRHLLVIDPAQRYTAEQALAHVWFGTHKEPIPLDDALAGIRKAQLRKKLRAAARAAAATQKLRHLIGGMRLASEQIEAQEKASQEQPQPTPEQPPQN